MVEVILGIFYFLVCLLSAHVNLLILDHKCPVWIAGVVSCLFSFGGMGFLKYSKLTLASQAILITSFISVGYFLSLYILGSEITKNQWIGLILVLFGSIIMNK